MSQSAYTVGRGKPPLHTRFQKGQSGNPSGKPGPAKLAKDRFARELWAQLESDPAAPGRSAPESGIALMARRLVQDALAGRTAAQRLVLSLLDRAHTEQMEADRPSLDDLLWPDGLDVSDSDALSPLVVERDEAELNSLVQGIRQGKNRYYGANATTSLFWLHPPTSTAGIVNHRTWAALLLGDLSKPPPLYLGEDKAFDLCFHHSSI